jgi:hypothetical protein
MPDTKTCYVAVQLGRSPFGPTIMSPAIADARDSHALAIIRQGHQYSSVTPYREFLGKGGAQGGQT